MILKRPNFARIDVVGQGGLGTFSVISDGKQVYTWFPADKQFSQVPSGQDGRFIRAYVADQVEFFFRPQALADAATAGPVAYSGTDQEHGVAYDIVVQQSPAAASPRTEKRFFIAKEGRLVHGVSLVTVHANGKVSTSWAKLANVKTNVPVEDSAFAWKPSNDAGTLSMPSGVQIPTVPVAPAR